LAVLVAEKLDIVDDVALEMLIEVDEKLCDAEVDALVLDAN
jgi:hypothetical protein